MTPYYRDDWLTVYHGDCREVMAAMEPESVHCVVTSPPFWGLRDYGTATWMGGDAGCAHVATNGSGRPGRETPGGRGGSFPHDEQPYRDTCGKCGAIRQDSQLGLEPTPDEYVANLVAVFREVKRVLRADGTVWLNLGDSYVSNPSGKSGGGFDNAFRTNERETLNKEHQGAMTKRPTGLKPKDLVGIPWRVAFALQADGWYLRSEIIWHKPNPMPESVTDRPTKAHETIFLLSKSATYFFDQDAVREPMAREWDPATNGGSWAHTERQPDGTKAGHHSGPYPVPNPAGRNIRSVWTMATQPYPGAHFATFPETLPERCIKAGTSEKGVCPECGAPWERVVEATKYEPPVVPVGVRNVDASRGDKVRKLSGAEYNEQVQRTTTGWRPGCHCDHEGICWVPATILDPFAGSGTTGMVAQSLSRRAVLIDLSLDYLGQLMDRNRDIPLGLGA